MPPLVIILVLSWQDLPRQAGSAYVEAWILVASYCGMLAYVEL